MTMLSHLLSPPTPNVEATVGMIFGFDHQVAQLRLSSGQIHELGDQLGGLDLFKPAAAQH